MPVRPAGLCRCNYHDKCLHAACLSAVNFKDVTLTPTEPQQVKDGKPSERKSSHQDQFPGSLPRLGVQKNKLVIIMVGLPGRGKTFLCNKLKRYLNWLGHNTQHFNVGNYRRKNKGSEEQDASFFDQKNEAGARARQEALLLALDDLLEWLNSGVGQVAILDGTNSTNERRNFLRSQFHGRWQYLYIESICSDEEVLNSNYRAKMRYSPDYKGMDEDKAVMDFRKRISNYEEVYEPITDRNLHYIKLIDM
ncbi:6-phosphofructo-2-kinase-domain-containing protein [Dunaliella salina]|uniref:6-phosphofructo-2-kinase-domain-containing protein n=1 Tax=Dunaliella salina TaxID=3046 RepID=A0ABQ7GH86_DUNSA|nr:6-phosphofructo-2-kinase-domain-containing protein [Dunaliella salina]|eukprot:KAF5833944.1 6-phosphofructo-2-kinase-domain-containing protein [Dunaliella salina]